MAKVLIRTEAGPEIGKFRLQRALILCRLLEPAHDVTLVVSGPPDMRRRLGRLGLRVVSPLAMDQVLLESQVMLSDLSRPVPEEDWLARASLIRRLSLVDMGRGAAAGELVVDGSIVPFTAGSPSGLRRYGGADYSVLEPRLRRLRACPRPRPGSPLRLGVCLGPYPSSELRACLTELAGLLTERVSISMAPRCQLSRRSRADWLASRDVILTSAGYELYEAAALGLPALVFWQDVMEAITARHFAGRGYGRPVGEARSLRPPELAKLILALASDPLERRAMLSSGRELVDGRGGPRVAALVGLLAQETCEVPSKPRALEVVACPT